MGDGRRMLGDSSLNRFFSESTMTEYRHDIFQAISDPTRRRILRMLARKEMSIAEIKMGFPLSRTAVNKHLHLLEDAATIVSRRRGRETRYKLNPEPFREVSNWLAYFDAYWDRNLDHLKKVVEGE